MKRCLLTFLTVALSMLGSSCIVSNLSNGFDLKSPGGILMYLGILQSRSNLPPCNFDEGAFDTCSYSP